MQSSNFFKFAGWCAILSWIPAFAGFGGAAILVTISALMALPFCYAMLVSHRARAGSIAVFGGVLLIAGQLGSGLNPTDMESWFFTAMGLATGVGIAIFAYLGLSSSKVPTGLAMVGFLVAALSVVWGFSPMIDTGADLEPVLGLPLVISTVIWSIWYSVRLIRGGMVEA